MGLRRFSAVKQLLVFLFLSLFALHLKGQELIIPQNPEEFSEYLEKKIAKTKNDFFLNKWNEIDSIATNHFDSETLNSYVVCVRALGKRGHGLLELQSLLKLSLQAHYSNQVELKPFFSTVTQLIENEPKKKVVRVFDVLEDFYRNGLIYNSRFNKIYAFSDTIELVYSSAYFDIFNDDPKPKVETTVEDEEDFGLFDIWDDQDQEEDLWDSDDIIISDDNFGNFIDLPKVGGIILNFKTAQLSFVTQSDSLMLTGTTGTYDIINGVFVGQGGTVNWSNVGLPEAVASLDKYSFKPTSAGIQAEDATLVFDNFLKEPIKGILELKVTKRAPSQEASYPRFKSYKNDAQFSIEDDNIDFIGGFSLLGNRIYSTSVFENISSLTVNRGLPNNFKVVGKRFEITDSLITSKQVSFTTYIQKDSIHNPAVQFRYEPETKQLQLVKLPKGGYRNSMYSDTFHQMDIKSDGLKWNLNEGNMDFHIISAQTEIPAVFESFNYFNPDRLRQLTTVVGWNPLIVIGNHVFRKRKNIFEPYELEKYVPKSPQQVKAGVRIAMEMGFVDYDPYSKKYALSRKGLHYYRSSTGRTDYDDLVLASVSSGGSKNATIDRNSNALDIEGTEEFKLSEELGITFLPKNKSMKMEGSNTIKFEGEIIIKNYRIVGDFDVDYEGFKVNLKRIDTIAFTPIDIYRSGQKYELGGHIEFGKTGTLYLNAPNNKSGRKKLPQYPKLEIPGGALVKFNNKNRDYKYNSNVLFKVPSISQDSLNEVDMAYEGQFYSGGIIPGITEILTVMPDTSIGFSHFTTKPYPLYKTSSTLALSEPLEMTKKGLVTAGSLKHISTQLNIEKAKLLDTVFLAQGPKATIEESFQSSSVYFPKVNIAEYTTEWLPFRDSLKINSQESLSFYNGSSQLTGNLLVREQGLYGAGSLERSDSKTSSNSFKFNQDGFLATKSTFTINALNENALPVLEGNLVDVDFKVDKKLVFVSPNDGMVTDTLLASIQFPNAAYKTTIDQAKWDINAQLITMEGDLENSRFFALNANQFGLNYSGTNAEYDIKTNALKISGIEEIGSVDAFIKPEKGEVFVKEGKIEPLTNATVITDSLNKYHVLTQANITINSKLSYEGDASYQYVNVSKDTFNIKMGEFTFAEISPEGNILRSKGSEKLSTIANARVESTDSIFLSPKIIYQGDMTMLSPFKNLSLNGSVRPILEKYPFLGGNWINYKGNKSESIQITVDNTLKDGGKPLYAGLHLQATTSSDALYPTFLSAKRYEGDFNVYRAQGQFSRDEVNKRFVIENEGSIGRYELYDDLGVIKMEGQLNLFQPELNKYLESSGEITAYLDSMHFDINSMVKYNFPIPQPMLLKIGESIVKANLDAGIAESAIQTDDEVFQNKMKYFAGEKATENYIKDYPKGHIPLFNASPKFFASILFSDLQLTWDPISNSFHNLGLVGISNIGETDINANMPGYFEIVKNSSTGDEIYLFLEASSNEWYYFGYKNNQLGFVSSNLEVNKFMAGKESSKSSRDYELIAVDTKEALDFRKKYLITYLGASEEDFKSRRTSAKPGALKQVKTDVKKPVPTETEEEEADGF